MRLSSGGYVETKVMESIREEIPLIHLWILLIGGPLNIILMSLVCIRFIWAKYRVPGVGSALLLSMLVAVVIGTMAPMAQYLAVQEEQPIILNTMIVFDIFSDCSSLLLNICFILFVVQAIWFTTKRGSQRSLHAIRHLYTLAAFICPFLVASVLSATNYLFASLNLSTDLSPSIIITIVVTLILLLDRWTRARMLRYVSIQGLRFPVRARLSAYSAVYKYMIYIAVFSVGMNVIAQVSTVFLKPIVGADVISLVKNVVYLFHYLNGSVGTYFTLRQAMSVYEHR